MISFNEVGAMLDEIAAEFPKEIFYNLNGGINLLPDAVKNEQCGRDDIFILGEYVVDCSLGRYINVYYGSFIQLFAHMRPDMQRDELKKILAHEFVHHLESMAGERDLEIEDALEMQEYMSEEWEY